MGVDKMDNEKGLTRRQFLGLSGGVLGAAALASLGMNINWQKNNREIDPDKIG